MLYCIVLYCIYLSIRTNYIPYLTCLYPVQSQSQSQTTLLNLLTHLLAHLALDSRQIRLGLFPPHRLSSIPPFTPYEPIRDDDGDHDAVDG